MVTEAITSRSYTYFGFPAACLEIASEEKTYNYLPQHKAHKIHSVTFYASHGFFEASRISVCGVRFYIQSKTHGKAFSSAFGEVKIQA